VNDVLLVQELLRVLLTISVLVFNSDRHLTLVIQRLILLADLVILLLEILNLVNIDVALVLISSSTSLSPALKLLFSFIIRLKLLVSHFIVIVV
jgi:hypothetical protein